MVNLPLEGEAVKEIVEGGARLMRERWDGDLSDASDSDIRALMRGVKGAGPRLVSLEGSRSSKIRIRLPRRSKSPINVFEPDILSLNETVQFKGELPVWMIYGLSVGELGFDLELRAAVRDRLNNLDEIAPTFLMATKARRQGVLRRIQNVLWASLPDEDE